jgi:hypothetical protein
MLKFLQSNTINFQVETCFNLLTSHLRVTWQLNLTKCTLICLRVRFPHALIDITVQS